MSEQKGNYAQRIATEQKEAGSGFTTDKLMAIGDIYDNYNVIPAFSKLPHVLAILYD